MKKGEILGIDVSHHNEKRDGQGNVVEAINWKQVAQESGVEFVFIKATEGGTFVSPRFEVNWKSAAEVGLVRGAYHFFRYNSDPEKQALHFAKILEQNKFHKGIEAYAIDLEWTYVGGVEEGAPPAGQFAVKLKTFIDVMRDSGFTTTPFIYTTKKFWDEKIGVSGQEILSSSNLWIARWYKDDGAFPAAGNPGELPIGAKSWYCWQYTSKGKLPGIPLQVDLNYSVTPPLIYQAGLLKSLTGHLPYDPSLIIASYLHDYTNNNELSPVEEPGLLGQDEGLDLGLGLL